MNQPKQHMISFKEFQKIDLRIAKVIKAENIEGSDKLLKLQVDLGEKIGKRQIIAGIAEYYSPESLKDREIVLVANLEEKEIFGQKSQGMLLAANFGGKPVLLEPGKKVPPGSKIH